MSEPGGRVKPPRRSRARPALVVFAILAVAVLVVGSLAPVYVAHTEAGHAWLARRIGGAVSDAIPGSLVIGRIETVSAFPAAIGVSDLKLLDPNGMTVLHVREAKLAIDPWALLGGDLHVTHAEVEGGQLVIAIQRDGRSSIDAALSSPSTAEREPNADMALRFDAIDVQDYVVELKPSPDDVIRIRVQSARVRIEDPPFVLDIYDVRARVQSPRIAGSNLRILHAEGWVHGGVRHVLELTLQTAIGNGELDARLSYFSREKTPVVVLINPHDGAQAELAGLLLEAMTWGTDTVEVTFDERVTEQVRGDR